MDKYQIDTTPPSAAATPAGAGPINVTVNTTLTLAITIPPAKTLSTNIRCPDRFTGGRT